MPTDPRVTVVLHRPALDRLDGGSGGLNNRQLRTFNKSVLWSHLPGLPARG